MYSDSIPEPKRYDPRHNYGPPETTPPKNTVVWDRSGMEGRWRHDLFGKNKGQPSPQNFKNRGESGGKGCKLPASVKGEMTGFPRLHVGNLPRDLTENDIYDLFSKFTPVKEVLYNDDKGVFQGEIDVFFGTVDDAIAAHKNYIGALVDGKPMTLALSTKDDEFHEAVPIAQRLSIAGGSPKKANKFVFKKNYGAPQRQFFHRTARERKNDKPYNDNFLDRLADDEEFHKEQEEKRSLAAAERELQRMKIKREKKVEEEMMD